MRFFTNLLGKITAPFIGTGIGELPFVIPAYHLLWQILKPKDSQLVDVQGFKMYTDPKDSAISPQLLSKGCWEPVETEIFTRLVKSGMTVVDIGANIGYYSLLAAKLVGTSGKVYAFEPFASTFNILERNIAVNEYSHVISICKAVTNKNSSARMYFGKYTPACNSLMGKGEFVNVKSTTLDSEIKGKVDLIKMDIEGAEVLAFEGMQTIIRDNPHIILITEVFPKALLKAGSSFEEYVTKLLNQFDVKVIEEKKRLLTTCVSLGEVRELMSGKMLLNLVCTRK
jgi:FkbM family methyltransferase